MLYISKLYRKRASSSCVISVETNTIQILHHPELNSLGPGLEPRHVPGQFLGSLLLVFAHALLELGAGRQVSNLAVVRFRRPGKSSLLFFQGAQDSHFGLVAQMLLQECPALAAISKGALVAKAQFAVFGAGSTALGTNLAKTERLWQSAHADCFLIGLEV